MHNSQSKVNMKVYIETVFNKVTFKSASFHIWIFGLTNANFCLRFDLKQSLMTISLCEPRSVKSRVLGINVGDIKARKWYLVVILLLYIGLITSFCLNISLLLRTYPKPNESSQTMNNLKSKGNFFSFVYFLFMFEYFQNNSHLNIWGIKRSNLKYSQTQTLYPFYHHTTSLCCECILTKVCVILYKFYFCRNFTRWKSSSISSSTSYPVF